METSRELLLSAYPNINIRTISDVMELNRLFSLISRHQRTIQDLGPMLRQAQKNLDDFLQSSECNVNVPKATVLSIVSNVEAMKEHIEQLCLGASRAEEDLKQLRGPMHPIRQCPTDILQYIFEWVAMTQSSRTRLQCATNLSHVCYRWRKIAIKSPNLWTHLYVSLKTPPQDIEFFWTQTIERMKMCQATISIEDIDNNDTTWEGMKRCRLDLVPNLRVLKLRIADDAAHRFEAGEFYPPRSSFETLEIGGIGDETESGGNLGDDFSYLLERYSPFKKLVLEDFDFTEFTPTAILPTVLDLTVRRSSTVILLILATVFPNAKAVRVHSSHIYDEGDDVDWPDVEILEVASTPDIMEYRLKMPKITRLDIATMPVWDNGFGTFISSHPSLQHLDTRDSDGSYSNIVSMAPQLVSLSMPAREARTALEFPNLVRLQLVQTRSSDLLSDVFDRIVRKFFLSSNAAPIDPTSVKRHHRNPSFTILVPIEDNFMLIWREFSVLVPQAVEEISVEYRWNSLYRAYNFEWK